MKNYIVVSPQSGFISLYDAHHCADVISLISPDAELPEFSARGRHLVLRFHDIIEPRDGYQIMTSTQMQQLLEFGQQWDRRHPLAIHCYAGISRSPAAAFCLACSLMPDISEHFHAQNLRQLSAVVTPNRHMIALADRLLARNHKMVTAIEQLGRGQDAFEGTPFSITIT